MDKSIQITDIYGVEPPSHNQIVDKVSELIERLEMSQYQSGYLVSKFGKKF